MGIWTGIKYAINSTLGSNDFMPLDKLIKSQRTLGASDSTLIVISNELVITGSNDKKIGTVVAKNNGNVRLRIYGYANGTLPTRTQGHAWVENSSGIVAGSIIMDRNNEYNWYYVDFNVHKDEKYTVYICQANINRCNIGASVIDGSMMSLEE